MPLGNFTCVLKTHFKEVLDVLSSYSLIKKNDVIPAYEMWISVGINDVNYDVDRRKDICSCSKPIYTCIDNSITGKRNRAFGVLGEDLA